MGYFGSYVSLTVDKAAATKETADEMRRILKVGVKAFVEQAKSIVPVWSGAERAAFTQIAAYADVPVFGPGSHSEVTHTEPRGVANQAARQAEGEASESFEVDESSIGQGKISFKWSSSLPHLNVNNRFDARQWGFRLIDPGPYLIKTRCGDAFKAAVEAQLKVFKKTFNQTLRVRRLPIG